MQHSNGWCRRTYTSSSRQAGTSNSAAVSLASRNRSEDEGSRGGEIVTIALVPAGEIFILLEKIPQCTPVSVLAHAAQIALPVPKAL